MNYDATALVSGKIVSVDALREKGKINILDMLSTYVDSLSNRGYVVHGNQSLNREGILESSKFSGSVNGANMEFQLFVNPHNMQKGAHASSVYVVAEGPGTPFGDAKNFFSNVEETTDEILEGIVGEYYVQAGFAEVPDCNNDFHVSCMGLELDEVDPLRDLFADSESRRVLESFNNAGPVRTVLNDLESVIGTSEENVRWQSGIIGGNINGTFLYGANGSERRGALFSDISSSNGLVELTKVLRSGLF